MWRVHRTQDTLWPTFQGLTTEDNLKFIPEQFTVKAHPALFEGEGGGGGGEPKNEALLFQSTVDIHFQNAHKTQKTAKARTLCIYFQWYVAQCSNIINDQSFR